MLGAAGEALTSEAEEVGMEEVGRREVAGTREEEVNSNAVVVVAVALLEQALHRGIWAVEVDQVVALPQPKTRLSGLAWYSS
jgi:hypothetical protein